MVIRALVLSGSGINCENESALALNRAGIATDIVLVSRLKANLLKQCDILIIPGGFSYGDSTGAGNILAYTIQDILGQELHRFVLAGKIVMGICNGCQTIARLGLFGASALDVNDSGKYECRWVHVRAPHASFWFDEGEVFYMPIAHKEGRFSFESIGPDAEFKIALQYSDQNPNGSMCSTAAITNNMGNVLGIMPHPERAILVSQTPMWPRIKKDQPTNCQKIFDRMARQMIVN